MDFNNILIKEDSIENAVKVHATISEFTKPADVNYFRERYKNRTHFILVAYIDSFPVGYLIAYDKYKDGSIYYWMVGVNPDFRNRWILSQLTDAFESWSREKRYNMIHVKTRESRPGMPYYLRKSWYTSQDPLIDKVPDDEDILLLQKKL